MRVGHEQKWICPLALHLAFNCADISTVLVLDCPYMSVCCVVLHVVLILWCSCWFLCYRSLLVFWSGLKEKLRCNTVYLLTKI